MMVDFHPVDEICADTMWSTLYSLQGLSDTVHPSAGKQAVA